MQIALKCADLGHASAPWEVHQRWVVCLEEEMFLQVTFLDPLHAQENTRTCQMTDSRLIICICVHGFVDYSILMAALWWFAASAVF